MPVGLERVAENRVTSQLLYTISSFPYSKVCVLLRRSILLYIACWQAISCPVQSVCICCTIDWSICQYNLSSLASGRQVLEPRKLFSFFLLAVLFLIFYFLFFLDSRNLIPFSPPKTLTGFSIIFFPSSPFHLICHGHGAAHHSPLSYYWSCRGFYQLFDCVRDWDCCSPVSWSLFRRFNPTFLSLSSCRLPHLDI